MVFKIERILRKVGMKVKHHKDQHGASFEFRPVLVSRFVITKELEWQGIREDLSAVESLIRRARKSPKKAV